MPERSRPDTAAPTEEITITRFFDAPRELVFKAWTEPERFASWFGPADSEVPLRRSPWTSGPAACGGRRCSPAPTGR
jgi:uncharacterized protein YndB with AHSA1/START domain